ncbi:MAG: hypothetical protein P8O91_08890 [Luminiphilus sp.]|nr:hypothetical protein [Luminiphilus sp.]
MSSERRDYFRVDTSLVMGWRLGTTASEAEDPLTEINHQISAGIHDCAPDHPTVAHLVTLLNNKLDAIRDELSPSDNRRRKRRVNISGSGISFTTTREAIKGSEVEISLILPTTNTPVTVLAYVISCKRISKEREEDQDQFRLRTHYQSEQDVLTEQIVHFVSKKQQEILAERRHLTHPDLL